MITTMPFQPIKRIIPQAMHEAGIDNEVSAALVLEEANKSLARLWGAERARDIEPVSFEAGVLQVEIRSAGALHTVQDIQAQWMNEINRVIGERKVREIVLLREGF